MRASKKLFGVFVCALTAILLLLKSGTGYAATLYVPDGYSTIQEAVNVAREGDTVIVGDGIYRNDSDTDIDSIVVLDSKDITIISENGPEKCILDGETGQQDRRRVGFNFHGLSRKAKISGFTVTNCATRGITIFGSSPTISNCIIANNKTELPGAGIGGSSSSPLIENCVFSGNSSEDDFWGGGGLHFDNSPAMLINCTITGNHAIKGGGISSYSSNIQIQNCIIGENSAKILGGGIRSWNDFSIAIGNCVISSNWARHGGGIYLERSYPKITNCTITMNKKDGIRCVVSDPVISNSILWDNRIEIATPKWGKPRIYSHPVVSYSNVQGSYRGTGNIDMDPAFINPPKGDFRLSKDSPCINAGTNDVEGLSSTDLAGNSRIRDVTVDMGAYEYQSGSSTDDTGKYEP